jgi:hypothetical protein
LLSDLVAGVSAVVHPATNYSMDPDPHKVVPGALAGVHNALTAAAKEPSVKRFVLTSSSAAALIPRPDEVLTVTTNTWNEDVIKDAYRDPPYEPERAYPVYAASKTLAEKEAWKFVEEEKPGFVLNTGKFSLSLSFASLFSFFHECPRLISWPSNQIAQFSLTSISARHSTLQTKVTHPHLV